MQDSEEGAEGSPQTLGDDGGLSSRLNSPSAHTAGIGEATGAEDDGVTGQQQAPKGRSSKSAAQHHQHDQQIGAGSNGSKGGARPKHPRPTTIEPCPRCGSNDTKFCYYNNYNVNQPRFFCKACQRYWTAGGMLRNVPPGSGRRKSKSAAAKDHDKQHNLAEQLAKQGVASAMLATAGAPSLAAAVPFLNPMLAAESTMLAYNAAAVQQQALLGSAAFSALSKMPPGLAAAQWGPHNGLLGASGADGLGSSNCLGSPTGLPMVGMGDSGSAAYGPLLQPLGSHGGEGQQHPLNGYLLGGHEPAPLVAPLGHEAPASNGKHQPTSKRVKLEHVSSSGGGAKAHQHQRQGTELHMSAASAAELSPHDALDPLSGMLGPGGPGGVSSVLGGGSGVASDNNLVALGNGAAAAAGSTAAGAGVELHGSGALGGLVGVGSEPPTPSRMHLLGGGSGANGHGQHLPGPHGGSPSGSLAHLGMHAPQLNSRVAAPSAVNGMLASAAQPGNGWHTAGALGHHHELLGNGGSGMHATTAVALAGGALADPLLAGAAAAHTYGAGAGLLGAAGMPPGSSAAVAATVAAQSAAVLQQQQQLAQYHQHYQLHAQLLQQQLAAQAHVAAAGGLPGGPNPYLSLYPFSYNPAAAAAAAGMAAANLAAGFNPGGAR